jgi:hypothetical protein
VNAGVLEVKVSDEDAVRRVLAGRTGTGAVRGAKHCMGAWTLTVGTNTILHVCGRP